MAYSASLFVSQVELLCAGQFDERLKRKVVGELAPTFKKLTSRDRFGVRQLNEVLLLLNERIVEEEFFLFLAGLKSTQRRRPTTIRYLDFGRKIEEFRKLAMLQYGSFRFAYNKLSREEHLTNELGRWLRTPAECETALRLRQKPLCGIDQIRPDKLIMLGYLYDGDADEPECRRQREIGKRNFDAYLSYDYLDVYVATSMRQSWDYHSVNTFCRRVFGDKRLRALKVRHFDPTINFHENSIAKALIEGLMLKRAKCTIYMVQETDTLGKDSEMASTLAQGKPVIAYVPKIVVRSRIRELEQVDPLDLLHRARLLSNEIQEPDKSELQDICAKLGRDIKNAETSKAVRERFKGNVTSFARLLKLIAEHEKRAFDKRFKTLHKHPLRFQIALDSGVANGVLVARTPKMCAELVFRILTNRLDYQILSPNRKKDRDNPLSDKDNHLLIENLTNSAFRVVTRYERLANSFWNLYKRRER